MIDMLKATPRMDGVDETLMPGEPEARKAAEQQALGVQVPVPVVRDLRNLAEGLRVELPPSLAAARG